MLKIIKVKPTWKNIEATNTDRAMRGLGSVLQTEAFITQKRRLRPGEAKSVMTHSHNFKRMASSEVKQDTQIPKWSESADGSVLSHSVWSHGL